MLSNTHKDRAIIEELQREVDELRRNEKDYHDLNFLLTSLESKYSAIAEEKRLLETEFAERSEVQIRHIAALKVEVDTYREALTRTQRQLDDAQAEISACKDVADHRQINGDRIKMELKAAFDSNTRLKEDNSSLESQLRWHKEEKRSLVDRIDSLSRSIEEVMEKNEDLERMLEECEKDKRTQMSLNAGLQNEYEILSEEVRAKSIIVNELEMQSNHALKQVQILDSDLQQNAQELKESRMTIQRLRDEIQDKSAKQEDSFGQLKSLQQKYTALLQESSRIQAEKDDLARLLDEGEVRRGSKDEETKRIQAKTDAALQEAKTEVIRVQAHLKRVERELIEKNELLSEMERQSQKALQTILRLESENKEIINDYSWVRQQLDQANQGYQAECDRNADLLGANRDLEETVRENTATIDELERREKELREISEEIMEVNREQKRELVALSTSLEEAQRAESQDRVQVSILQKKNVEMSSEKSTLQGQIVELKAQLSRLSQQLETKEHTMLQIEEQSKASLATLLKLEEEHKKMQQHNIVLSQSLQETTANLENSRRLIKEMELELRSASEYATVKAKNIQEMRAQLDELVDNREALLIDIDRLQRANALLESQNNELQDSLQNVAKEDQLLKQLNEKKREIRETRLREEHQLKMSLNNLKSTLQNNTQNMYSYASRRQQGRDESDDINPYQQQFASNEMHHVQRRQQQQQQQQMFSGTPKQGELRKK